MVMKRFFTFILPLLLLLPGGCSSYKDISVSKLQLQEFKADLSGKLSLKVSFSAYNPTSKKITLQKADITAFTNGSKLANGELKAPVEIPANGSYTLTGEYIVQVDNPLLLLSAGAALNLQNKNARAAAQNILLNIDSTIKIGSMKKNFKYRNFPLQELL